MDRETIVNFCNNRDNNRLAALEIIAAYCEEMGKSNRDIDLFINALYTIPMDINFYLNYAIKYYKRKYIIFDLYRPNNMVENQGWYFVKSY